MADNGQANHVTRSASFLIADCGHTHTSVALFDKVENSYRFIARATTATTLESLDGSALIGIQQAIRQLSAMVGRPFLTSSGSLITPTRADGSGVDEFALTVSAVEPIRTLIVGLLDEVSIAGARQVLDSVYGREVLLFNLADQRTLQNRVDAIRRTQPELILIAGGTDGGADEQVLELVEAVALGVRQLPADLGTQVLYLGNVTLRETVTELMKGAVNVHMAENVRPTLEEVRLDDARQTLGKLFTRKLEQVTGLQTAVDWGKGLVLPTVRAFANVVQYMAALTDGRVMGVDIGSDTAAFMAATVDELHILTKSNTGVGRPIANLLREPGEAMLSRWLPNNPDDIVEQEEEDIAAYIYNKSLFPRTVPMVDDGLHMEQAVARTLVAQMVEEAAQKWGWEEGETPPLNLLLLRGSMLANMPRHGQALSIALDALQPPAGMFAAAVDQYHVLPALGVLAQREPLAVVASLEGGALVDLGWVVVVTGRGRSGRKIMSVKLESASLGSLEVEVAWGSLEVLPLPAGEEAKLTLKPRRGFDAGFGPGKRKSVKVHGGEVGLVIDARGRPLRLPEDDFERRALMRQWLWDMGG